MGAHQAAQRHVHRLSGSAAKERPMIQTLAGAISALRQAGEMLAESSGRFTAVDPGPAAFGAAGPGRLGDLGRDLYLQWQRALDARAREAAAHGARLAEAADAVARASGTYYDTDESARRSQPEVS